MISCLDENLSVHDLDITPTVDKTGCSICPAGYACSEGVLQICALGQYRLVLIGCHIGLLLAVRDQVILILVTALGLFIFRIKI